VKQIGDSLTSYLQVTYSNAADAAKYDEDLSARATVSTTTGLDYTFWDADMSQSCVCDAGFSGPDCSERLCPMGDDPLTTGQHNEVQYVDVYGESMFAGTITFTYTDEFGEQWETASFETTYYSGQGTTSALATDAQSALQGLPGGMLNDVGVKVHYCEDIIPGYHKATVATDTLTLEDAADAATSNPVHSPTKTGTIARPDDTSCVVRQSGNNALFSGNCATADTTALTKKVGYPATKADAAYNTDVLYKLAASFCIRYEITFSGRSGDVADIKVNTAGIVTPSGVAEHALASSSTTVSSSAGVYTYVATLDDLSVQGISVGEYVSVSCNSVVYGFNKVTAVSGNDITFSSHIEFASADCTTSAVSVQRGRSHWTVDEVSYSVADRLKFSEDYTGNSAHFKAYKTDVTCASNLAQISSKVFTCTDDAGALTYNDEFGYKEKVDVKCGGVSQGTYSIAASTTNTITFAESIPDCTSSEVVIVHTQWVVKTNIDLHVYVSTDGHGLTGLSLSFYVSATTRDTCSIDEVLIDSDGASKGSRITCDLDRSVFASTSWTAINTNQQSWIEGAGTTEVTPCSGRGLCDKQTGLCECFDQYSKNDCSTQNNLAG